MNPDQSGHRASPVGLLFNLAQHFYSDIPYHFVKSGHTLPPWHYILELTRRCNLRCKMCQYITWLENVPPLEQKDGEMTTEQWHGVIDQIHRFSIMTFTGGELFVRKDFLELMEHASRRGFTHMISNLTLMNDERINALAGFAPRSMGRLGLNFLGTSVEGTREVHDKIRRMEGSFDKTTASIRALREARESAGKKCPVIHVTTVMQQANVEVLPEMPRIVKAAGGDVVNFVTESRLYDTPGIGVKDARSFLHDDVPWPKISRPQLKKAIQDSMQVAREVGIQLRMPRMPFQDLLNYYEGVPLNLNEYECRSPWNLLGIGPTGVVGSCAHAQVGNVQDTSLSKLWNSVQQRNFRKACKKELFAPCPGCCLFDHRKEREMAVTLAHAQ